MRLLRSEEDLSPGGGAMTVAQLEALAREWYGDRLDPEWQPRSRERSQAILDAVGLSDPFWRLA
jgi:RecB family exonuclease